ncbi:MAG: BamA/TamA family outer membrane protein [Candidatus Eisenbacteria bacterium]|uniref:BamA/TamA family outer membrane protein n=1 Tax=Eiseniibacteriota bacterium TaxID=2212470 RepID=A0A948S1D9_UNCEI|nr:BamA/TamA family outer membrane protein [Candidatus Eisenbacteria bacterium]MBU1947972.1 BamA/TamA family outer membrane protein [Candidatus Eisenbacteria bacterium]MBU2693404.1 BamA/TamA family outer membrane protein [Candidatus Eisenbacteria bacterium]
MGLRRFNILLIVFLFCALTAGSAAQFITFGKNKVQYSRFDWQILESSHFRLYYYPEEARLAEKTLVWAEESYESLRRFFARDVGQPVPLIIYSSHQDFEQTNVTPSFLPEGVAGLTEFTRGRILLPFNGSINDFRETLQHELVHAFQLSIYREASRYTSNQYAVSPPLWFTEGIAVHWSEFRDARADMILRDLCINGRLPGIEDFWRYQGSFIMYKLGQSILDYLGETYGEDRIREFYLRLGEVRTFNELFPLIYGISVGEMSDRWEYWVRQRYYPDVELEIPILFDSKLLTTSGQDFKPTPVPGHIKGFEHHFIFISARTGYSNIYAADVDAEEKDLVKILTGQRQPEFESFHAFSSRMDVSADGELIFVSKHDEKDALFTLDLATHKIKDRYGFENLIALSSPSLSPDGQRIVFSGLSRAGQNDLYLFDRRAGILHQLTDDLYDDISPDYHPGSDQIVFVSDRGPDGKTGARNLFLMDLNSREIRFLTCGPWEDLSPSWSPDGQQVLFASSRADGFDLFTVDLTGRGRRRTQALEALLDPRWLPGGEEALCSVYTENKFRCARIKLKDDLEEIELEIPPDWDTWPAETEMAQVQSRPSKYDSRMSLDVAQGAVVADPALRYGEGIQAVLSDLMGNRLLYLQLGNSTISTEDFLRNFSAGASLMDVGRRLNRGVSAYYISGDFYDAEGLPYFERRSGASFLFSYPFDKFHRVETSVGLAYSEKDWPRRDLARRGPIANHYLSFIRDNSLWLPTGPIDGERMNLTVGITMNLRRQNTENALAMLDLRRYWRIRFLSAYAVRFQARISEGPDPQLFVLGGTNSLRGYPYRHFSGTRSLLLNQEIRFPLARGFAIGLPMGVIELPGVQGALFFDVGKAWEEDQKQDLAGSYGISFRMGLAGFIVFRFDVAGRTDFKSGSSGTHTDFFVGWNY